MLKLASQFDALEGAPGPRVPLSTSRTGTGSQGSFSQVNPAFQGSCGYDSGTTFEARFSRTGTPRWPYIPDFSRK